MVTLLVILLVLILVGGVGGFGLGEPGWDPRYGGGSIGLVLVIVLIWLLLGGRLR